MVETLMMTWTVPTLVTGRFDPHCSATFPFVVQLLAETSFDVRSPFKSNDVCLLNTLGKQQVVTIL